MFTRVVGIFIKINIGCMYKMPARDLIGSFYFIANTLNRAYWCYRELEDQIDSESRCIHPLRTFWLAIKQLLKIRNF